MPEIKERKKGRVNGRMKKLCVGIKEYRNSNRPTSVQRRMWESIWSVKEK